MSRKPVSERSRSSLEDQMWRGLGDAFLGCAAAIFVVVIGGFVAFLFMSSGWPPLLVWPLFAVALGMSVWWERLMSREWREAHGELVRRREAKEDRKERERRAALPYSTEPPIIYDPSKWTGA